MGWALLAASEPANASGAITIAWIGAGGAVLAGFVAVVGGIVQSLLKNRASSADTASWRDQLQWEHDQRMEAEKKVAELQADLLIQERMNDALIRRQTEGL